MPRVSSSAEVASATPAELLASVCERFERRAVAKPDLGLTVERGTGKATVDFGWGTCALRAADGVLALRAEADDEEGLDWVCEVVERHLGSPDASPARWDHRPAQEEPPTAGRDRMRGFHARARHGRDPS